MAEQLHFHWSLSCIGEGNGTPLQSSCLENPWMEEPGGLQSMGSLRVRHGWATSLSLFSFMHWRREMATHSSVLAWRIPGMPEPGGLLSTGSHRVGHDWSDLVVVVVEKGDEIGMSLSSLRGKSVYAGRIWYECHQLRASSTWLSITIQEPWFDLGSFCKVFSQFG